MGNDIDLASHSSNVSSAEKRSSKDEFDIQPSLAELNNVEHNLKTDFLDHRINDPNMDTAKIDQIERVIEQGDYKAEYQIEEELEEDSPYPEVRAAVSNVDDPTMPVMTFRTWVLGMLFTIVIPGVNQLLSYRYPTVTITSFVAQLLAYPMGVFMAKLLPTKTFKTPFGSFTLNPGPFNVKEHTVITVMSNVTYQRAYASNVSAVQRITYGFDWGFGYIILLTLSSQLIGFSMAGFFRRWLVWPAAMIWPANLGNTALFTALHRQIDTGSSHMSRYKFFMIACASAFAWYFLPGYLFALMSAGNWFCLIAPNNVPLNQMLGTSQGLGLIPLTFDWNQYSYNGNPIYTPWWAQANVLGGFVVCYCIIGPILYYKNVWHFAYMPFSTSGVYDRFGHKFKTAKVTTANHLHFDADGYNNYSEQYFSVTYAISFALSFASITAVVVHVALFHGKQIYKQFTTSINDERDIHARLMQKYPEVPKIWYAVLFVICFAMGIGCCAGYQTDFPVWAFIISLIIGAFFMLPVGIVYAISNVEVGLNVISEFIIGYMHPGSATGMMMFKVFCYMAVYQGLSFTADMKLGHYMKVPPRDMFVAQVTAIVVSSFVVLGVQSWVFSNIDNVCTPEAADKFTCNYLIVFGTASQIWGLIGPGAVFSPGKQYGKLLWMFMVGAIFPVIIWGLTRKFPRSFIRKVNTPVIFTGTGLMPPATGINFTSWALCGFVFNYIVKKYRTGWWTRYNYVLGAALDTGTAISAVIIFFCLIYPSGKQSDFASTGWWGNTAYGNTADASFTPYKTAPADGFAPAPKDFRPYFG
ncbi:probable isp4 - oligopeptide transporter [Melanopsichium pennsylvanicum]|uniref:Probable isp4 - oligopeptide transporter n=2 Tax=Melanopsichium pennsylvanicum TaxID=63383 RepID=A0AAJ4XJN9_9BASI|nr:probable isp4-oligopeptide transporter [Melanopsichium pennsylvanicum 4]SNX83934.1 probable isp4 - oligopeptide transporter [Melanopsichium pennsylvanicum]